MPNEKEYNGEDFEEKEKWYKENYDEIKKTINVLENSGNVFQKINSMPTSIDELLKLRREQFDKAIKDIENSKEYKAAAANVPDSSYSDKGKSVIKKGVDEQGREYETIEIVPPLAADAPPLATRYAPVDLGSARFDVYERKTQRLNRLYGDNGVVYRFNRGFVLIDQDGRKQEEILDFDSSLHHSPELLRMAREDFGINLNPNPSSEFEEYMEATSNGLIVILYESSSCQIFLPPNITEEQVDQIISEVEPRDFVYDIVSGTSFDDAVFGESLSRDDVLDFLRGLKEKFKEDEIEENNDDVLTSRNTYVNELLAYISANGITLNDYFTRLAENLRSGNTSVIPEFESKNPFLTQDDIARLLDSKDDRIVEYFAHAMTGVIELNLNQAKIDQEDTKDDSKENLDSGETYINNLLAYIKANGITINDYYIILGNKLRKGDYIGIPEFESRNPFLSDEDIARLLDSKDERIVEHFANAMTGVIELNLNQAKIDQEDKKDEELDRSQKEGPKEELNGDHKEDINDEELEREIQEAYIKLLMSYINKKGISLEEYYRLLATKLRSGDVYSIPRFEGINPFLSEDDIKRLLDEKDERIVDYFAHTMSRVIELNLENVNDLNNIKGEKHDHYENVQDDQVNNNQPEAPYDIYNNDSKDQIMDRFKFEDPASPGPGGPSVNPEDDAIELDEMTYLDENTNYMSGIKITYINTDLINKMSGLAVIKEPKTGRLNIYGYEHDDSNLSGKKVIDDNDKKIESGYYVNLNEYIGILTHGIEEQYGENSNLAFVDEKGEYLNFYEVINEIMAACRREGALRYGKEYKGSTFDSYEEVESQYTGERGLFKGIELTKGLYVRRDVLIDELNKYRVAIAKENIENMSHVR